MKIKLIETGWSKFNGSLSGIEFVDGISVGIVSGRDAARVGAAMRIQMVEGENPSPSAELVNKAKAPAPIVEPMKIAETVSVPSETAEQNETADGAGEYTEDSLAAIADAKGISGLREIAEPLGVRDKSISGLIKGIIEKTSK